MSDHIEVLLVGCGSMAIEYAKVLTALGVSIKTVGNSKVGADRFYDATGIKATPGSIELYVSNTKDIPSFAIVATPMLTLATVTRLLLEAGVKNILVEKPGCFNMVEALEILTLKQEKNARINIAYNRRFLASSMEAERIIAEDGGLSSFNFEFTEWASTVEKTGHPDIVKQNWLLGNSTHVIDLAFYHGGHPVEMYSFISGELSWHINGAVYSGAGRTDRGCLFSYQANWLAPGRWGVELLTNNHRIYLRPMEKIGIQKINSVSVEELITDDELDKLYKPGFYEQTRIFLTNGDDSRLCTIEEHVENMKIYERIAGLKK